jgi:hypothetical protein
VAQGNKKDAWISLNPETGERTSGNPVLFIMCQQSTQKYSVFAPDARGFCPVSHPNAVYIGKTEYHISMAAKDRNWQWNATFLDYSSHLLPGLVL